ARRPRLRYRLVNSCLLIRLRAAQAPRMVHFLLTKGCSCASAPICHHMQLIAPFWAADTLISRSRHNPDIGLHVLSCVKIFMSIKEKGWITGYVRSFFLAYAVRVVQKNCELLRVSDTSLILFIFGVRQVDDKIDHDLA